MAQSSTQSLSPFDVLQTYVPTNTTDSPSEVGAVNSTPDGRKFRMAYILPTGSSLSAAKLTQGPAVNTYYQGLTISAQSIGDTTITATLSASANNVIAANVFAGGFISIITSTGSPAILQIKSHPAVTASSTSVVFTLKDPIVVATGAAATANIVANPYYGNIVMPTTKTGVITGIPMVAVTVDSTYGTYFWSQVGGLALALGDTSGVTAGLGVTYSYTNTPTAGAVTVLAATYPQIGMASSAFATTVYGTIDLNI